MFIKVLAAVCLIAVASAQIWTDFTQIQQCAQESTHDLCLSCCRSDHWSISIDERLCERRCEHLAPVGKRQSGDVTEIVTCHHLVLHTACVHCCQNYTHWETAGDKQACVSLCDSTLGTHFFVGPVLSKRDASTVEKRQLFLGGIGDIWSHVQEFQHCERETATTEECRSCCQSAHFAIQAEEGACELLCPITHG